MPRGYPNPKRLFDKAARQVEKIPLMAVHHRPALLEGVYSGDVGVVDHDEENAYNAENARA